MSTQESIIVDKSAIERITKLRTSADSETFSDKTYLRVAVLGGGCSGFYYEIGPDNTVNEDDVVFENSVIVDQTSLPFLKGAVVKFESNMVGAKFAVDNPNAQSSCGCQTSFSVNPSVFAE